MEDLIEKIIRWGTHWQDNVKEGTLLFCGWKILQPWLDIHTTGLIEKQQYRYILQGEISQRKLT
jgi:hypothetical protein